MKNISHEHGKLTVSEGDYCPPHVISVHELEGARTGNLVRHVTSDN